MNKNYSVSNSIKSHTFVVEGIEEQLSQLDNKSSYRCMLLWDPRRCRDVGWVFLKNNNANKEKPDSLVKHLESCEWKSWCQRPESVPLQHPYEEDEFETSEYDMNSICEIDSLSFTWEDIRRMKNCCVRIKKFSYSKLLYSKETNDFVVNQNFKKRESNIRISL